MERRRVNIDYKEYPEAFHSLLKNADVYDSSCSLEARVIYIDKGEGLYLKKSKVGSLKNEAELTAYFRFYVNSWGRAKCQFLLRVELQSVMC